MHPPIISMTSAPSFSTTASSPSSAILYFYNKSKEKPANLLIPSSSLPLPVVSSPLPALLYSLLNARLNAFKICITLLIVGSAPSCITVLN